MLQETKKIRKEIYDFIKSKGVELSDKDMSFISEKIKEHSDARENNFKEIRRKYSFAQEKIAAYLKKAKTMPTSSMLKTQENTLKLVSTWLNQDAE